MKSSTRNSAFGKLIRHSGLVLCFLIQMGPVAFSQPPLEKTVIKNEKNFSEELFIKTDRDLYAAGEKVWFRVYKLNSLTLAKSDYGKVTYVDILDLDNNPVDQLKIEMDGYSGSGDFILPDTLRTGNYTLRAYTNWMQNFSKDLFAYKNISVINPFDKITNFKIPYLYQEPDSIIFFPEGGHLQAGLKTSLGFKIVDRKGNPVKMKGFLADEKNDTLCMFQTGNNGYGFVSVSPPDQGRIFLIPSDTQHKKFQLPDVRSEGILLTAVAKSENSQAIVKVNFSPEYVADKNKIYLEIYSSGLAGIRKNIISDREPELNISYNDIPYGISHLAIVDEKGTVLSARWISREGNNIINYKIDLPENKHAARENIKFGISATDDKGNPVKSDFSVSVVKSITAKHKTQAFENCRQFPGMAPVIEDCELADVNDFLVFYKSHDPASADNTDGEKPAKMYIPELEGHLISGTLREKASGDPMGNEKITLSFVGKKAQCLFTKTDSSGNFNFVTREHGLKEIVIQPLTPEKECYVDINNPFPSGYSDYNNGVFYLDTNDLDKINNIIISMQINNIYEPFYPNQAGLKPIRPEYNFYGPPDNSILMSKYIELTSVKEIVAELIPGVVTTKNNGRINFRLTKPYQTRPFENGPLVLVDGVPVYDLNKVVGINSKDIEKVDVLIDRYFISGNVIDGILHFITKKGNLSALDLDRSVFRMEYDLLENKDTFYSPDYSLDSLKNNHLPDFRNTLYWNPDMHTTKDGKATVEFYSSDEAGEYTIIIEGSATDGKTGIVEKTLFVKSR